MDMQMSESGRTTRRRRRDEGRLTFVFAAVRLCNQMINSLHAIQSRAELNFLCAKNGSNFVRDARIQAKKEPTIDSKSDGCRGHADGAVRDTLVGPGVSHLDCNFFIQPFGPWRQRFGADFRAVRRLVEGLLPARLSRSAPLLCLP